MKMLTITKMKKENGTDDSDVDDRKSPTGKHEHAQELDMVSREPRPAYSRVLVY